MLPPPNLEAVSQLHTLTSRGNSTSEASTNLAPTSLDPAVAGGMLDEEADELKSMQNQRYDSAKLGMVRVIAALLLLV